MTALQKTIVATGLSSGLGFELARQLLEQAQPYRIILGARNVGGTQEAFEKLSYDRKVHQVNVLPLEQTDLPTVKTFAQQTLEKLGQDKIDYLCLNAAMFKNADESSHGYKWCDTVIVNHFSHHYLTHLLHDKLVESKSRIVQVSSGAVRNVPDPSGLDKDLIAGVGGDHHAVYSKSKFVQFLGAQWWRRELKGHCDVVTVSPGLIPNTGLGRDSGMSIPANLPDAKSVPEGAASILAAFTRSDLPQNPEQIFLTSWGEWWPTSVYAPSLDKILQEKWCPTLEGIENGLLKA